MNAILIILVSVETAALAALLFFYFRNVKKNRSLTLDMSEVQATREKAARSADVEKNRLIATLESMAEGVAVIDTRQKVVLANSVLEKVLGLGKDRARGRHFWEIFRDPQINSMIEKSLKEKVPVRGEDSLLLTRFTFEIQVSPVFRGKDFLGAVAVFHDVTKLKELERMRSEFVANVSHELKTPLTSIIGFVETLKEGAIDDAENRTRFLQIVGEHAEKLNHLIEELLLLSELESEREIFKKEAIDLGKAFEALLRLFDGAIKAKQISVRSEISPSPFLIMAEPKSIEQAFSNLLDNAIKYNRLGGEIVIKASQKPEAVEIEIRDTGIGIPPADLSRIFERFYRVDKSRSRESGGTGLGLSIVKHIIESHGGKVHAKSDLHKGSVFTITLPK
ncbi:MAG: sensor histidine kinase [Candidatus Omnitrophota bacterium]